MLTCIEFIVIIFKWTNKAILLKCYRYNFWCKILIDIQQKSKNLWDPWYFLKLQRGLIPKSCGTAIVDHWKKLMGGTNDDTCVTVM